MNSNDTEPNTEQYGSVREAAAAYGISERGILKRIEAKTLEAIMVNKVWRVKLPVVSTEPSVQSTEPIPNQDAALIETLQADVLFLRAQLQQRDIAESELRRLMVVDKNELQELRRKVSMSIQQEAQEAPSAPQTAQELATVDNVTPEEKQGPDRPSLWWHRLMKWRR